MKTLLTIVFSIAFLGCLTSFIIFQQWPYIAGLIVSFTGLLATILKKSKTSNPVVTMNQRSGNRSKNYQSSGDIKIRN